MMENSFHVLPYVQYWSFEHLVILPSGSDCTHLTLKNDQSRSGPAETLENLRQVCFQLAKRVKTAEFLACQGFLIKILAHFLKNTYNPLLR